VHEIDPLALKKVSGIPSDPLTVSGTPSDLRVPDSFLLCLCPLIKEKQILKKRFLRDLQLTTWRRW
jgi:hypothetical protein